MQKQILFFSLFSCLASLSAQTINSDSPTPNNYKREISIDVRGLFNNTPGSTLIYKKALTPVEGQSDNVLRRRRIQIGLEGTFLISNTGTNNLNNSVASLSTKVSLGREKLYQYGKFGLYYGTDYSLAYGLTTQYNRFNDSNNNSIASTNSIRAELTPFAGLHYRFSPRFSLNFETGLSFWTSYNRSYRATNSTKSRDNTLGVGVRSENLRLITMGYHF
jgi:hypothetical protein